MLNSLLFTGILATILLVGCGAGPTPTPTPTTTPAPTLLESAEATLMVAREAMQAGRIGDLAGPVLDVLCKVEAGDFAPDLTLESVTDSTMTQLAIRGVCAARGE